MIYNFTVLALFYANVVVTFAVIYILLDITDLGPVVDHYETSTLEGKHWFDRVTTSLYFSVLTLFSVGYGDVTPFGWSRAVAIIQATFGYILPAVLVIQYMKDSEPAIVLRSKRRNPSSLTFSGQSQSRYNSWSNTNK
ncbi:potassium channel LctB [Caldalkalibacillus uzonensis]|uniref:Potassium channel LctB n=1 Tax=Caldalkalibacillus uzonensis TaxID=353224 RepID=A0ABU0CYG4_9BACI|nr:potassium channel family protein [Caldalkalibacillus uzonensis]MDQ0341184.1 potassium channel LctB [Caldalkalibacillus uzonensis]